MLLESRNVFKLPASVGTWFNNTVFETIKISAEKKKKKGFINHNNDEKI